MATLIMLVGIPGVGKSTYVNSLRENGDKDFGLISSDQYVEKAAKEAGKTYSQVFKEVANDAQKRAFADVDKYVRLCADIVWDQTNLNIPKRAHRLKMIPNNYIKCAVNFRVDDLYRTMKDSCAWLTKLIDRANARPGKHIEPKIFLDMIRQLQYADYSEGFDFIHNITVKL